MDFHRYIKSAATARTSLFPFISVIFLTAMLALVVPFFAMPASLEFRLPRAFTSDMVNDKDITIVVTSENIVYVNEKVTTLQELKALFARTGRRSRAILIKADRRASVGRVMAIADAGRNSGFERINIAADQEE